MTMKDPPFIKSNNKLKSLYISSTETLMRSIVLCLNDHFASDLCLYRRIDKSKINDNSLFQKLPDIRKFDVFRHNALCRMKPRISLDYFYFEKFD